MPKYRKETLEAMQREKERIMNNNNLSSSSSSNYNNPNSNYNHNSSNIVNVDYIKERYRNNNPITKEEIEETFKNAFKDIFKNIFESEIESELGYSKYDYKNKRLQELKLKEIKELKNSENNAIHDNTINENNNINKNIINSRNGYSKKTLRSDLAGDFEVNIPRDRNGNYEPILVPKYQRDISTFEDKILAMYAKGMSTEAINNFMEDMYKISISTEQISRITDKIIPLVKEWQNRPLQSCYPIIFLDGMVFDVLESGTYIKKTAYVIIGIDLRGYKNILGIWIGEKESSKYWLMLMNELKSRGVEDIFIASIDGLTGFKEAITTVYPKAQIQRCIVHIIRNCVAFVNYKDLDKVCSAMKPIYKAITEEEALFKLTEFENNWKSKYPYISKIWRNNWNEIKTMFQYPQEVRRLIYTTNPIESFNNGIKRITKTKGSFKSDNSLLKLMYLITQDISKKWTKPIQNWSLIFNQLLIFFGGRMDCFLNKMG